LAKPEAQLSRSKYRAVRTDGFHSKKEAARARELRLMEKAGEIRALRLQPSFNLEVNGKRIARYIADFHYYDVRRAAWITEDTKGFQTDVYKLKKKLLFAIYGIEILET